MEHGTDQPTQQPTPTQDSTHHWRTLTSADAVANCPVHRAQHEEFEARYAEFLAENGASIRRRDRQQLGLRIATPRQAVTA